jgi:molecular chaperone GrpE (heat shock protein)
MFRDPFDPWGRPRAWPQRPRTVPAAPRWPAPPPPTRAVPVRPAPQYDEVWDEDLIARPVTPERGPDRPWQRPPHEAQPTRPEPPPTPEPLEKPAPVSERPRPIVEKHEALRAALEDIEGQKRRFERERERVLEDTRAQVIEQMLPVLDNLDRSIAASEASASNPGDPGLLEGIRLVRAQFEEALARTGLQRIESVGHPFDPSVHEAVGVLEVDNPELAGMVMDEWQRGYRLGDRVMRAPKVRVGRLAD